MLLEDEELEQEIIALIKDKHMTKPTQLLMKLSKVRLLPWKSWMMNT